MKSHFKNCKNTRGQLENYPIKNKKDGKLKDHIKFEGHNKQYLQPLFAVYDLESVLPPTDNKRICSCFDLNCDCLESYHIPQNVHKPVIYR